MRKGVIPSVVAQPTEQEYCQAALIAARRSGELPSPLLAAAMVAILLFFGMQSFSLVAEASVKFAVAALFFAGAALVVWLFFFLFPSNIAKRAKQEYVTHCALRLPMQFDFTEDVLQTASPILASKDSYARIREWIETPQLLIFCKDRVGFYLLPKRCLPQQNREQILEQLRVEFSRHRHAMKNWIF